MGIDDLEKIINRKLKKKEENERKRRQEEIKKEEEDRKYLKIERLKLDEKLAIFKEIESFGKEFVRSKIFKRLSKLGDYRIEIYGGEWGHVSPSDHSHGCWSYVSIDEEGKLTYNAGYKWMGTSKRFDIDEDNFSRLNFDYLRDLRESIKSGGVYDYIKRELKNIFN